MEIIVLNDFDNCLGDKEASFKLSVRILVQMGITTEEQLTQFRTQREETGGSFDLLGDLERRGLMTSDDVREFCDLYGSHKDSEVLRLPGATEYIDFLRENDLPRAILTTGGADFQTAKIVGAGLGQEMRLVTDRRDKAAMVAEWHDKAKDVFHLPQELGGGSPRFVILVEDKYDALIGLPVNACGIHVHNTDIGADARPLHTDKPDNIFCIGTLRDAPGQVRYIVNQITNNKI